MDDVLGAWNQLDESQKDAVFATLAQKFSDDQQFITVAEEAIEELDS